MLPAAVSRAGHGSDREDIDRLSWTYVRRGIVGVWVGLVMITVGCSENVDRLARRAVSTPTVAVGTIGQSPYSVVATSLVEQLSA